MNSSETPGSTSIFRPTHKFMRCLTNALKSQMFIPRFSKFNLGGAVGVTLLLASCHSDATSTLPGDTELEVSKGPMEGGELLVNTGVAFIKPGEATLKPQKQVFVDANATKTVSFSVSTLDLGFIGPDLSHVVEPGSFGLRVKDQTTSFELKTNKYIL